MALCHEAFRLRAIWGAIPGNSRVRLQVWMLFYFLTLTGPAFLHCCHQGYLFGIIGILLAHSLGMLSTALFLCTSILTLCNLKYSILHSMAVSPTNKSEHQPSLFWKDGHCFTAQIISHLKR